MVMKSFRAGGQLHIPGTILDAAETSLGKLAGFVKLLHEASLTSASQAESVPEPEEKHVEVISGQDARETMGPVLPFPPQWLKSFNEEQLERLAIMTVDGGLTDDEALRATGLCGTLLPFNVK
jgi:hypothetical protein